MKWMNRLMLLSVIFLLPFVILIFSVNLVLRMPDFYQYEFNQTAITSEMHLGLKEAELADSFSGYMWGRAEQLVLEVDYLDTEEPQNIFTPEDEAVMERLRTVLNVLSLLGAVLLIPIVGCYYVLIRSGEKDTLRRAYSLSVPLLVAYAGVFAFSTLYGGISERLAGWLMKGGLAEESIVAAVFTPQFAWHSVVSSGAIALILCLVLGMVTWSLTKPYRMFGPGRRDRV